MGNPMKDALERARACKKEQRMDEAEAGYIEAAKLARANEDLAALAHALRHISDLARERGAIEEASAHAKEAAHIYRRSPDRLGLANAIRLQALSAAHPEEARTYWREARDLYSSLGVHPGVQECDLHLE